MPRNPELHFSSLKNIARSPAHYRAGLDRQFVETPAMRFGTLVHAMVLGGDYVVYDGERRGKAWSEFASQHDGTLIVTASEHDRAERCAQAVASHPIAYRYLVGDTERSWAATLYGRRCAGRIDVSGPGYTVDLKTTTTTEPGRFQRQCLSFAYHAQLAWYQDARRALGEEPGEAIIIGVETAAPYAVTVLRLTARALEEGRKLCALWTERLRVCEEADEWPAYTQTIVDMDIVQDDELTFADESEAA